MFFLSQSFLFLSIFICISSVLLYFSYWYHCFEIWAFHLYFYFLLPCFSPTFSVTLLLPLNLISVIPLHFFFSYLCIYDYSLTCLFSLLIFLLPFCHILPSPPPVQSLTHLHLNTFILVSLWFLVTHLPPVFKQLWFMVISSSFLCLSLCVSLCLTRVTSVYPVN